MNELAPPPRTNPLAIWSLILGIISFFCCGLFTGIPAVICGHMAHSRIKNSGGSEAGSGMAIAGLVIGYMGIFLTTIGILAAIAVPNFIAYRDKAICSQTESQAYSAAQAVSCYFSEPSKTEAPTIEELMNSDACSFTPSEKVTIEISGTVDNYVIIVYDNSGRCPMGSKYQISAPESLQDGWFQE